METYIKRIPLDLFVFGWNVNWNDAIYEKENMCFGSNPIPTLIVRILQSYNLLLAAQYLYSLEMTLPYSFADNPIIKLG